VRAFQVAYDPLAYDSPALAPGSARASTRRPPPSRCGPRPAARGNGDRPAVPQALRGCATEAACGSWALHILLNSFHPLPNHPRAAGRHERCHELSWPRPAARAPWCTSPHSVDGWYSRNKSRAAMPPGVPHTADLGPASDSAGQRAEMRVDTRRTAMCAAAVHFQALAAPPSSLSQLLVATTNKKQLLTRRDAGNDTWIGPPWLSQQCYDLATPRGTGRQATTVAQPCACGGVCSALGRPFASRQSGALRFRRHLSCARRCSRGTIDRGPPPYMSCQWRFCQAKAPVGREGEIESRSTKSQYKQAIGRGEGLPKGVQLPQAV
jgi:hypothetical protein